MNFKRSVWLIIFSAPVLYCMSSRFFKKNDLLANDIILTQKAIERTSKIKQKIKRPSVSKDLMVPELIQDRKQIETSATKKKIETHSNIEKMLPDPLGSLEVKTERFNLRSFDDGKRSRKSGKKNRFTKNLTLL